MLSKRVFYLMNKDIVVMIFSIIRETFSVNYSVESIKEEKLIPRDLRDLSKWVDSRYVLSYRQHIQDFFNAFGIKDIEDLIEITNCVSLRDTYWVKEQDSKKTWRSISPYTNPLNKTIADYSFSRKINGKYITASPDFSTDGQYPKCWKRVNGNLYLYKAGIFGNEPYSEVYANRIAKSMGINSVRYDIGTYRGVTVSKCKCITNEKLGIISYGSLFNKSKCDYVELLNQFKGTTNEDYIIDMLLLDYVICNIDRHYGNIALFVENSTNNIKGFTPLFDHNLALLPHYHISDNLEEYIESKYARDGRTWVELYKLISCRYVRNKLQELKGRKFNLGYERDSVVNKIIQHQVKRVIV